MLGMFEAIHGRVDQMSGVFLAFLSQVQVDRGRVLRRRVRDSAGGAANRRKRTALSPLADLGVLLKKGVLDNAYVLTFNMKKF